MAERLFREIPVRDVMAWNSMIYIWALWQDKMPFRNVISWTSIFGGLDQNGKSNEALCVSWKMVGSGVGLSTSTMLVCVLTAFVTVVALPLRVQIHGRIVKLEHCFDEFMSTSLTAFYANCKQIENAGKVFDEVMHKNVVVWTALVAGYGSNSKHEDALEVFGNMIKMSVLPNQSSFTSALNSCCGLQALDRGRDIQTAAIKLCLETDVFRCNSSIVMYATCGPTFLGPRRSVACVASVKSVIRRLVERRCIWKYK